MQRWHTSRQDTVPICFGSESWVCYTDRTTWNSYVVYNHTDGREFRDQHS